LGGREAFMIANNLLLRSFLVVIAFLSGCAAIDKLSAPTIGGTPGSSALIVVKCEATMHGVLGITTSQEVVGGVLLRTDGSGRIDGQAVAGLIIFSGVPPGDYNLARVETNWRAGNMIYTHRYNVPPQSVSRFIVSVKIGEPRFLGVVTVEESRNTDDRGVVFALKPSKSAERDAWQKFIQLYQGSPWIGAAQQRLSELGT
jgi:uncharacterized protein YceK